MNKLNLKRWTPLAILGLLICFAYIFDLHEAFNFELIKQNKEQIKDYSSRHQFVSVAGFLFTYIICVALSLPIATLLTLLGGFLYGSITGTCLVVVGATTGATILFLVTNTSLGTALQEKALASKKGTVYIKVQDNIKRNAIGYLLFMRLVPIFPFWLVNILPAIVNVPLKIFVLTTFFGIIPGTFVYVNVGKELGNINTFEDIISPQILLAFGLLGLLALVPTIYKQVRGKQVD